MLTNQAQFKNWINLLLQSCDGKKKSRRKEVEEATQALFWWLNPLLQLFIAVRLNIFISTPVLYKQKVATD